MQSKCGVCLQPFILRVSGLRTRILIQNLCAAQPSLLTSLSPMVFDSPVRTKQDPRSDKVWGLFSMAFRAGTRCNRASSHKSRVLSKSKARPPQSHTQYGTGMSCKRFQIQVNCEPKVDDKKDECPLNGHVRPAKTTGESFRNTLLPNPSMTAFVHFVCFHARPQSH